MQERMGLWPLLHRRLRRKRGACLASYNDILIGNDGNNILDGRGGADTGGRFLECRAREEEASA